MHNARRADRIVFAGRVRLVVLARRGLLGSVRMNHGDATNGAVRLDDVDHAPGAEVGQGKAGRRLEGRLEVQGVAKAAAGLGEKGKARAASLR